MKQKKVKPKLDLKVQYIDGKTVFTVEERKTDPESLARYNKEDMLKNEILKKQHEWIEKNSKWDRSVLYREYKG